jgi:hypothetical protein
MIFNKIFNSILVNSKTSEEILINYENDIIDGADDTKFVEKLAGKEKDKKYVDIDE